MAAKEGSSPPGDDMKREMIVDEAQIEKIGAVEGQFYIDPVIDARITRKFDLHILPWLFGIW